MMRTVRAGQFVVCAKAGWAINNAPTNADKYLILFIFPPIFDLRCGITHFMGKCLLAMPMAKVGQEQLINPLVIA